MNVNLVNRAHQVVETCTLLHNYNIKCSAGRQLFTKVAPSVSLGQGEPEINSNPAWYAKRDKIARSLLDV